MFEDVLRNYGAYEVSAMDVYSDIFHLGEGYIQRYKGSSGDMKANPLAYWRNRDKVTGHYRVMFEDTFEKTLKELQAADFAIMNGISYFGRRNVQEHASKMFAMIFDYDGVTDETLNNFLSGAFSDSGFKIYPIPNYIILSGTGCHLYYVMDEPVPLYPNIKLQLKNFKYALTRRMWNGYTSTIDDPQYQGINQGFRVIGGHTKRDGVVVRAFRLNTHPFTLRQLGEYVPAENRIDETKLYRESKLSLAEAKEKYPEWYERVVIGKDKSKTRWKIEEKVHGDNPYALYDWWKRQIESGATYHHRYFAIMCLAVYGVKNGVPLEQVRKDARAYLPMMNEIQPDQPFTKQDIESAMECYDGRYCTFPIDDIVKITAIQITKNKRNGRRQKVHLARARAVQMIDYPNGEWRGRKSKQAEVSEWRQHHPDGTATQAARELGISRTTFYKYADRLA